MDRGSRGGEPLRPGPVLAIVPGWHGDPSEVHRESVHALPGSSTEYELVFRAGDRTIHRLVGSIVRKAGVTSVTFDPHDPVFSMQGGDDPRSISRLVAAFDQARRGDLTGCHECKALESPRGSHCAMDGQQERTPCGRDQAVEQDPAEVTKWATIHFDGGGQSPGPVTAACTVDLSDGSFDQDVKRFDQGTHNTAEWHALILGLRMALKHGERHVVAKGDSMLVVKQINGEWKTKNAALQSLRAHAEELLALFETWRVEWIPRKENRRADALGRAR